MAAQDSAMILDTPNPEAYLVDLQQGIQIFELRAYAAEMGHRLPARQRDPSEYPAQLRGKQYHPAVPAI